MTLSSKIDTKNSVYKENAAAMQVHIDRMESQEARIKLGGSDKAKARQKQLGKLLVRERIAKLIDPNTDFFELSIMAGFQLYQDNIPAAGIITGIGVINGIDCMIIANDASVKGGTYYPITAKKHLRAQAIAERCLLPCVYLVDSGGAFLPKQDEVFPDRDHFGRIFFNQANMSAKNIPQIAVVMGSCTAGGAYVPCMADIAIMVKKQATVFLGGPPLVKAATGEIVTAEELGGTDVHTRVSGVADYAAEDDNDALRIARECVRNLNRDTTQLKKNTFLKPSTPSEHLMGVINTDSRMPVDIKSVISCLVDDSEFDEFKSNFGNTLVCGFARIEGTLTGIIANNGILFSESAVKGTQFILLCNQRQIPMVFLQNITGFMVGKQYEQNGIAKHGAKMVNAVACSTVPKITIIIGGSYGAGNYAMCGRAYDPDFLFMWPNARISVMGGAQAAGVLTDIKRQQNKRQNETWDPATESKYKNMILAQYEDRSSAFYSSARLWDDGIINPLDTRRVLGFTLSLCMASHIENQAHYGVFRM